MIDAYYVGKNNLSAHVVLQSLYPYLPSNEASFSRRQIHHHRPRIASWSRVDTEWTPATDLIRNTTQAYIIMASDAKKVFSPHRTKWAAQNDFIAGDDVQINTVTL